MKFITVKEVIYLNHVQIEKYSPSEMKEVLQPELLESAVMRPRQSVFCEDAYETIFSKAAALYQSLARNHCFANANKRTSHLATFMFLYKNGYELKTSADEMVDFTLRIVTEHLSIEEISEWIQAHTRKM
ncbi:type II toxin-antitoxin system death-on-curing family toxin [Salicibibacter cibarius]|uniref:Type II toxin-antitoxin system death-on-curing family toxin n=1 Tax=Salicibibacter cibarius TaxID=2743000 RepID=A0A7T6Z7N8_9BACI|nr:type II toxin-antitoxin system death-on-curing family toxin [Salicibibacter cibarius]QQK78399.1 type II toxin-antitoxin system death-on-curing family toxin [Salicibibacter cibarius]